MNPGKCEAADAAAGEEAVAVSAVSVVQSADGEVPAVAADVASVDKEAWFQC